MKMILNRYIKNGVRVEMTHIIKMKADDQIIYRDNIVWNVAGCEVIKHGIFFGASSVGTL